MVVILMGVMGAGKTVVGTRLAERLGWSFADADDFHPPANIEKMRAGTPLGDEDRRPWLAALEAAIRRWRECGADVVLACSALKRAYRRQLEIDAGVRTIHLKGSYSLIADRLRQRSGHFAAERLLKSQFEALEEPEASCAVDIGGTPDQIAGAIIQKLNLAPAGSRR